MKKNITGGASLIYHRLVEAGTTCIPNTDNVVQKVVGLDCNGLYTYSIGRDQPVGAPILRSFPNFEAKYYDMYKREGYWLDYVEKKCGLKLKRQCVIFPYIVDAYGLVDNCHTIFEYGGCVLKHHDCNQVDKWLNVNE